MSERREPGFNLDPIQDSVPTLETPVGRPAGAAQPRAAAPAKSSSVATVLLTLLVLVSLGAAAALGVWGMQLKQQMEEQQVLVEQMNLWLESTDATLTQTSTTASRSGETLMGRVEDINTRLEDRIKHFDSEIAKLWTVSFQRNKPQLEEQGKTLVTLGETVVAQDARIAEALASLGVLRTEIESQVTELSQLSAADQQLEQQLEQQLVEAASAGTSRDSKLSALETQTQALQSELEAADAALATVEGRVLQVGSDMEFQFSVERDERAKLAADLNAKINQAAQPQGTSVELERRLRTIEERLKAIDASRASLNAELLKVQGQVNGLMLDRSVR